MWENANVLRKIDEFIKYKYEKFHPFIYKTIFLLLWCKINVLNIFNIIDLLESSSSIYSIIYPCTPPPAMLPSYFHLQLSYFENFSSIIFHCLDRFSGSSFPMSSLPASPRYFFQSVSSCVPCPAVITFSQFPVFLSSWLFLCFPFPIFLRIRIVFSQFDATYFTHVSYTNCQIPNFLVCFFFVAPFSVSILLPFLFAINFQATCFSCSFSLGLLIGKY